MIALRESPAFGFIMTRHVLAISHALATLGGLFLLPPHAGGLEVLSAPNLRKDAVLLDPFVEPFQEALEGLSLAKPYF
jgi:hypothetical protein